VAFVGAEFSEFYITLGKSFLQIEMDFFKINVLISSRA